MLLYATYKTTKYSLQLHLLVVQTHVNYQVAAVIVTQKEKKYTLSKPLQIMKSNFNNLDVIFSVSFLTSLFSTKAIFLYFGFHMFQEE